MKRTLSLLLALVMVASAATFTASAADDAKMPFRDVKSGKWFYDAVYSVWSLGIMGGVSDTEFSPNGALSRAMFVTILGRMAGAPETGFTPDTFPDTKKNTWYSPYVGWAMEAGIVGGFDDGTFRPNANLTREQMAKAMAIYIDVSGVKMPRETTAPSAFSDEKKVAAWAREYVEVLRRAGIVNGVGGGRFAPNGTITRQEAATMIARAAKCCGLDVSVSEAASVLAQYSGGAAVADWAAETLALCLSSGLLDADGTATAPLRPILRCEVARSVYRLLNEAR